jgi:hypothetical protein
MYKAFNYNITQYESDAKLAQEDWEDQVIDNTIEFLEAFEEDWNELLKELPNKSTMWKRRLNECLENFESPYTLPLLLKLIKTEDRVLFMEVANNLCKYDLSNIPEKDEIYRRAELYLANPKDDIEIIVLEKLLKKKDSIGPSLH